MKQANNIRQRVLRGYFTFNDGEDVYEGWYHADGPHYKPEPMFTRHEARRLARDVNGSPNPVFRFDMAEDNTSSIVFIETPDDGTAPTRVELPQEIHIAHDNDQELHLYSFKPVEWLWGRTKSWEWNPAAFINGDNVVCWIRQLMFNDGINLHPDDDFAVYGTGGGTRTYTMDQAEKLNGLMSTVFDIVTQANQSIYEISFVVNNQYRKWHGLPMIGQAVLEIEPDTPPDSVEVINTSKYIDLNDYTVCYNWRIVYDCTQTPRKKGSTQKNRQHTKWATEVIGLHAEGALFYLIADLKKKRNYILNRVHSITPTGVSFAYHSKTYEDLPRELRPSIALPEAVTTVKEFSNQ